MGLALVCLRCWSCGFSDLPRRNQRNCLLARADGIGRLISNAAARVNMGDGRSVFFWVDKWIKCASVEDIAPDLFEQISLSIFSQKKEEDIVKHPK